MAGPAPGGTRVTTFYESRGYSPLVDAVMVRLTVFDKPGREFFMMLPSENGRRWRERRTEALDAIQSAIAQGLEPGEVKVAP